VLRLANYCSLFLADHQDLCCQSALRNLVGIPGVITNPPLQYMLAGCPLQVGTDFELESRLVWYWLARYGLRETRTRHVLRQMGADSQAIVYDPRWLPEGPQLHLYSLRLLFPMYPIELFSVKLGVRLFRAAVNPRAGHHCLVRRTFRWLRSIRNRQADDSARWIGLIISCGRGSMGDLPVLHDCGPNGQVLLERFEEVLNRLDRRCPPPHWQSSATADNWTDPSTCQESRDE
jgi:hypothetical protein